MLGNMMSGQLLISGLIEHAEKYHNDAEIVSRTVEGPIHRYTYGDAAKRSRQLANALEKLGLKEGDTVGTLAWNTFRHFELYFGVELEFSFEIMDLFGYRNIKKLSPLSTI